MSLTAVLAIGFFLGMRHAMDTDHVMAVFTIVSRTKTLRAAAPVGVLWGLGHSLTILLGGGAIIFFGIVVPPRIGLGMELSAALVLVLLGVVSVVGFVRDARALNPCAVTPHPHPHLHADRENLSLRPLAVGVVHGLSGSAAVALLVLGAIRDPLWALGYLAVFGVGTTAGMLVITVALALPVAATAHRFARVHRSLGVAAGVASIVFGAIVIGQISFFRGLFSSHPTWTPE